MSEQQPQASHRATPANTQFRDFMASGWAPDQRPPAPRAEVADYAARRRAAVSRQYAGERLVIPGGGLKVRSNDSDFTFRTHTAFAHLLGIGADAEPDSVLVLHPRATGAGHDAVLYYRPLATRDTEEFYRDSRYGEFWVGPRPTVADLQSKLGLSVKHLDSLPDDLTADPASAPLRVVPTADASVTALVETVRAQFTGRNAEELAQADAELARSLSTLRLVKDEWEIGEMRKAVAATHRAFEAVIASLPDAVRLGRGERWVEGVFGLHARHQGNGVGYESICASGDHANTIHWTRNTGVVRNGDLILVDAGVEVDSLFTADITRTLPVSGRFANVQRRIYDVVYEAQEAGMAAVRPGNRFSDIHAAADAVIAHRLHEWGLLPDGVTVEQTLDKESGGWHRRWMVHGTSHHLGMDVHDCQLLLRQDYLDLDLKPGMVLTVEPGLYFKADDLLAPADFRGTGVRIECNVVVTEDGCENLSAGMPRTSTDVEAWMARIWKTTVAAV